MRCNGSNWAVYSPGSWDGFRNDLWALWAGVIMRLEHHLVGGYVRYISPYIIIIIMQNALTLAGSLFEIAQQKNWLSKFYLLGSSMKLAPDYQMNEWLSWNLLGVRLMHISIFVITTFLLKCFHRREITNLFQIYKQLPSVIFLITHSNMKKTCSFSLFYQKCESLFWWNFHRLVLWNISWK